VESSFQSNWQWFDQKKKKVSQAKAKRFLWRTVSVPQQIPSKPHRAQWQKDSNLLLSVERFSIIGYRLQVGMSLVCVCWCVTANVHPGDMRAAIPSAPLWRTFSRGDREKVQKCAQYASECLRVISCQMGHVQHFQGGWKPRQRPPNLRRQTNSPCWHALSTARHI